MDINIALLPGDGIGPEVISRAVQVLEAVGRLYGHHFRFSTHLIGGCSIDRFGTALTDEALQTCQSADAVLLGAVGGPLWDDPTASIRPEQGLLAVRKELQVFANLRPVRIHPALINASPLKPERLEGVDLLVVRELTGGLYFGQPKGHFSKEGHEYAVDTLEYYDFEIQRVLELAFMTAQRRRKMVTSVDKANVLASSRLWRKLAIDTASRFPDVALSHLLVDTAAMKLVTNPASFDVLVTENMFGDILTDEASVLVGSMGMLPSASLPAGIGPGHPGLFEPIHGSAPDIAGKGIANPIGAILSAALMLRYSFDLETEASAIEVGVDEAIASGSRTVDLGGTLSTQEMTGVIIDKIMTHCV